MELQLALTLSTNISVSCKMEDNKEMMMKKKKTRSYDEAFEFNYDEEEVNSIDHHVPPQTLSLFVRRPNGDDEDDDQSDLENHSIHFNKSDEDEDGMVGWPPINPWRKRLCHIGSTINYVRVDNRGYNGRRRYGERRGSNSNYNYVKVKMEGVGIGRKVDISLHHSLETLTNTLIRMFEKGQEHTKAYKLAYQDKDGHWLLAQDVPWGTFLQSVQRLQLVKNGD